MLKIFFLMFSLVFYLFLPTTGFTSSPEAWDKLFKTIQDTCFKKSNFAKPSLGGLPALTDALAVTVVQNCVDQTKDNRADTVICLFNRTTGKAKIVSTFYPWKSFSCQKKVQKACGFITTRKSPLNIRTQPYQNAKKVGQASRNSAVVILETLDSWHKVMLNDANIGYGKSRYITQRNEFCGIVATSSGALNVREKASKASKVIALAQKETAIHILKTVGKWYQVKLNNGMVGYVNIDFVNLR
ncbi:SH3 domain-containing protein [Candidatus Parabeggiatoa sp. HSG14]|uniref:SH3 domain-containing protein n=1 Tax=Candidatus Parabeggiatoa sp. HSG14 TaxID=3055593 RepID=UPI0025A6CBD6|nr:SH3 domain-containing protein [Thiotrichales bacterium HSG14]